MGVVHSASSSTQVDVGVVHSASSHPQQLLGLSIDWQACERRQVISEEHLHAARLTEEVVKQKTTSVCDAT